jgi:valyl-tRNA synthetase
MSSPGGYDPKQFESEIYSAWEAAGHFHAEPDPSREPFVITIPPPNVTGALHLGHALNNTLQDILIRRKRMQGFNVCWLPGTDHAGIATQAVVEKRLREEQGLSRREIGREGLVKKIWEWKEEYNTRILNQLRRMGCSCDWQRTRFTLDEQCAKAVYETFFRFFKDGLIYRGLRLVNWDTQLQTAVADDEVYHETVRGSLWHIRYPIAVGIEGLRDSGIQGKSGERVSAPLNPLIPQSLNPSQYLVVATTRPETMLADTAVAVHPDDERYKHLIGKHVLLPLMNRPIPIVADGMLVKREFGTGCVKVTPGHDPNDYACWQRKLGQPDQIDVRDLLTPDGRIRPDYGPYSGMKKEEARKKVVADLEALGLLEKVEPYETEVGHSDRSKTPIEPLRSEQWFVKMDKPSGPRLAESAMEAVRDGRVQFFPERYAKTYLDWLGEKRDWCISRQLWWGHRIPVWTLQFHDQNSVVRELRDYLNETGVDRDVALQIEDDGHRVRICVRTERAKRALEAMNCWYQQGSFDKIAEQRFANVLTTARARELARDIMSAPAAMPVTQDPDVLDTWFSSALWPHSTFGWPENPNPARECGASAAPGKEPTTGVVGSDLDYFYPTSVLSTAREIITLWVARMVMTGLYNVGRVPFQHVYIHAVIQDAWGSRMSKSAGNGMDPLDLIDAYGADAMRISLAHMAGETQDVRVPGSYRCPHCAGEFPQQQGDLKKPSIACRHCKKEFATRVADDATIERLGLGLLLSPRFELGRNLVTKLWQAATGLVIPTLKADPPLRIERLGPAAKNANERDWHTVPADVPPFEQWIRVELLKCIREVDTRLDRFEFSAAVEAIRTFFGSELCDWYVEFVKVSRDLGADPRAINQMKITLLQALDTVLALFHPAMPFVTEALWTEIGREFPRHHELIWPHATVASSHNPNPARECGASALQNPNPPREWGASAPSAKPTTCVVGTDCPPAAPPLIVAPWPRSDGDEWLRQAAETEKHASARVQVLKTVCIALREIRNSLNNIRSAAKQSALRNLPAAVIRCDSANAAALREAEPYLTRLGQVEKGGLTISPDAAKPPQSMSRVLVVAGAVERATTQARSASEGSASQTIEIYVPIAGLADLDVERKRLAKERDESAAALQRLEAKLANEGFIAKAKPEVIETERARLVELREKLAAIERNLAELG